MRRESITSQLVCIIDPALLVGSAALQYKVAQKSRTI